MEGGSPGRQAEVRLGRGSCQHPFKVCCALGSLPSQVLSLGAVPGWSFLRGTSGSLGQEEGTDQRAGALTTELEMASLHPGEAQPETGWMGALGQGAGRGCEWRNQILVHSLWTKGRAWRGPQPPLTTALAGGFRKGLGTSGSGSLQGHEGPKGGGGLHAYWLGTQAHLLNPAFS